MNPRARLLAFVLLGASATLIATRSPPNASAAVSKERRFFNARLGVGVEAPVGWSLSLHTGYANVLCSLVHPGGSRISLAVDQVTAKNAGALAEQSRSGLLAQGLTIEGISPGPRGGVLLDARSTRRNQAVRQLYIVRDPADSRGRRQAVVLTLATPADQLAAASAPFDWVVAHLTLEAPVVPEEKPDAGK